MSFFRFCAVAAIPALLAACASAGNDRIADVTQQNLTTSVVKGKTNQAQIRALYGDPMTVGFTDSGNETWTYEFSHMEAKATNFIPYVNLIQSGAEGDKKSIVFFFDRNKIVQNFTMSNSKIDVTRGLVAQ